MMMYKNRKLIGILLLAELLTSCKKDKEQFILSSDENGIICSAKSTFNDTIFYENRFPDTTVYYYSALSKKQNEELRNLIRNVKTEKSMSKFELRPASGTLIIVSDEVRFYEANYSLPSGNMKKILAVFPAIAYKMIPCKKVENFWDVDGVTPPDNPIP